MGPYLLSQPSRCSCLCLNLRLNQHKDGYTSREARICRGSIEKGGRRALGHAAEVARGRRRGGTSAERAPKLGGRARGVGEEAIGNDGSTHRSREASGRKRASPSRARGP